VRGTLQQTLTRVHSMLPMEHIVWRTVLTDAISAQEASQRHTFGIILATMSSFVSHGLDLWHCL